MGRVPTREPCSQLFRLNLSASAVVNFTLSCLARSTVSIQGFPRPFKAIQGYSSPFNPIQGAFKKDIFFLCGLDALVVSNPCNPRLQTLAAQKAGRFKPMQGKKL